MVNHKARGFQVFSPFPVTFPGMAPQFETNRLLKLYIAQSGEEILAMTERLKLNRNTLNNFLHFRARFNPFKPTHADTLKSLLEGGVLTATQHQSILEAARADTGITSETPAHYSPAPVGGMHLAKMLLDAIESPAHTQAEKREARQMLLTWLEDYFVTRN